MSIKQVPPPYRMYIDDITASRRIGDFIKLKYPMLCQLTPSKVEAVCVYYTVDQISDLIKNCLGKLMGKDSGLRIYFATYKSDTASGADKFVPQGAEGQLTLIFAPTTWTGKPKDEEQHADTNNYFVLDPISKAFVSISVAIWKLWTDDYCTNKCAALAKNFDIKETKRMWYEYDKIMDLYAYIIDATNKIKYITAFFASYHDTESTSRIWNNGTTTKYDVHKQLSLIFLLATDNTDGLYTSLDFRAEKEWQASIGINEKLAELLNSSSGDTGVPCPPAVCN